MLPLPKVFIMGMKIATPTAAPNFPAAALTPWQVERIAVGKLSVGITNVVVFGPKLQKKKNEQ